MAQVLAANDITDLIGGCLELKPSGSGRFLALCPFHKERTPSFSVSRDKQMFYCFGCEKGGDAIAFLREYEGLTFSEALRKLADRAGIRLPAVTEYDDKEDYQRTQLLELGKFAAKFFRETLENPLKGGQGRRYLKTRHLSPEIVKRFGLGYAPDHWTSLYEAARAAGFKDSVLEASGLVRPGERRSLYDFFRNRLMFPIRDVSGNVVAFGGRDLTGEAAAKYVNTPENIVYKKGRALYALYEAREALRKEKRAVLVEGYFDLLRSFEAGVENAVATCGTALTTDQAKLLRRYVSEVVVVFDGDAAGVRAALRGIGILTAAGLTVRAALVPEGKDPDEYILEAGAASFRRLLDDAADFVTFYVRMNQERLATIEGRTDVARETFTILAGIEDELRRDEYLKQLARELHVNEWLVRNEFAKTSRGQATERATAYRSKPPSRSVFEDDSWFVSALLNKPPLLAYAKSALAGISLQPGPLADVLNVLLDEDISDRAGRLETEEARALYAAAANLQEADSEKAQSLVEKRVLRLRKEALQEEEARIQNALQEAERSMDTAKAVALLARKVSIAREIEKVGAT